MGGPWLFLPVALGAATMWQHMSIGNRIAITVIIVVVILFILAAIGYFTGNWEEDGPGYGLTGAHSQTVELEPCMDEETRERIRAVMNDALDEALKNHIVHVFEIWLKDERGQPGRAATGVRQGIKAYLGARTSTLKWNPPPCAH